jgi:hypothetical protein
MAISLKRDKKYVKRFSDAEGWIIECESNGDLGVSVGNSWTSLPYMSAPKIKPKEETAELKDGSNTTIYNSSQLDSYEFAMEILQADKESLDLSEYARGKFFMLIYKVGRVGDKVQYHLYAPGQIVSTSETDYSDFVKIGFSFKTVKNDEAISLSSLPEEIEQSSVEQPIIIPANKQRVIVEV